MTNCIFCEKNAVFGFRPTLSNPKGICKNCLSEIKELLKTI